MAAKKTPDLDPSQDPYEFEWPDDTVEERQRERDAESKAREVEPVSVFFAAPVLGITILLSFFAVLALIGGELGLLQALVLPTVVVALLFALPLALALHWVTMPLHRAIADAAYIVVGAGIGGSVTFAIWQIWIVDAILESDLDIAADSITRGRDYAVLFMVSATAAAFYGARSGAPEFSKRPRPVWILAGVIALLTVWSAFSYIG